MGRKLFGMEFEPARRRAELLADLWRDVDRTGRTDVLRIEPGGGLGAAQHHAGDLGGRHAEHPIVEPHAPGQFLRQPEIRPGLALRAHRGRRILHVVGAVGAVEILGFEIGRRRQDNVGIARRDRQERVVDDGEKIVAGEAAAHFAGIGAGHGRVVGSDEQRPDRRVFQLQQRFAEAQMVDGAGRAWAGRLAHDIVIKLARRGSQQQRAAALSAIGAGDAGQQRHRAQRLPALRQPRHAFAKPDEGGLGVAVERREALDVRGREAGDRRCALGGETRQYLAHDPLEAERVLVEIGAVAEPVAHQDVHDAQGQRRVGADADRQVPVGPVSGAAAAGVDDDERDAPFADGLDLRPEVHVGGDEVGAPGDDEIGVHDRLRVGAADRPDSHVPGGLAAGIAHRPGA